MEKPMIPDLYDRKLGLLEILAASWRIYTTNFKFFLLLVFLPVFSAYRLNYSFVVKSGVSVSLPYWMPSMWNIHVFFVTFVLALSSVCVVQITETATSNERVTLYSVRRVPERFLPVVLICFIFMIWRLIMFLLIPIARHVDLSRGGIFALSSLMALINLVVWVYTVFVYPLVGLKNKSVFSAFRYSFAMVRGRWWQMLWAWMVLTLPAGAVCFLIQKVVVYFGLVELGRHTVSLHALWSLYSLIHSFSMIGITVLFLNISRAAESSDPVVPVIPSENSYETVS